MMTKNGIVRIGIIGCGRIAGHHCRSIVENKGTDLIAVCDLDIERAKYYQDLFKVSAYSNYHEMLSQNPDIDTVAIVTPSGMHFEHALQMVSEYQKNIIVEKPTFLKPSHVMEVYETASKVGVNVFPVFQNRYNLAVQRVLKGLADGELGKIYSVSVRVRWCRPQRYYDMAPWRGEFSMDGGCLTNQGIHHIDLLRKLGGPVKSVCSVHRTLGAKIEVEDTACASLIFDSGAIGTLEITTAARPVDYEASLSLVCENGLAQIGGIAVNELQVYTPDPGACQLNSEDFSGNVYGLGHSKIYKDIVEHFNGVNDFPVNYQDTLETIKLLNSFYLSDESKHWVDVDASYDSQRLGKSDENLAKLYRTSFKY